MIGRRSAALLLVLLAHALIIYCLVVSFDGAGRGLETRIEWSAEPITWIQPEDEPSPAPPQAAVQTPAPRRAPKPVPPAGPPTDSGESKAIADTSGVDWPIEGKRAAEREVAREMEAERIAKMFAGPQGTWASLTKRQRSRLNKFRWRPGALGVEYDERGNQIYHLSDGCVIVNGGVIACALGKVKVHGDMFQNMREYFDEQRLPDTDEGNGTEPEALRPAN
jgi:hypothetical protein